MKINSIFVLRRHYHIYQKKINGLSTFFLVAFLSQSWTLQSLFIRQCAECRYQKVPDSGFLVYENHNETQETDMKAINYQSSCVLFYWHTIFYVSKRDRDWEKFHVIHNIESYLKWSTWFFAMTSGPKNSTSKPRKTQGWAAFSGSSVAGCQGTDKGIGRRSGHPDLQELACNANKSGLYPLATRC
jgi:hypothetical protein